MTQVHLMPQQRGDRLSLLRAARLPGAAGQGRSLVNGQASKSLPLHLLCSPRCAPPGVLLAPPCPRLTWDTWQSWQQVNVSRDPSYPNFRVRIANQLSLDFFTPSAFQTLLSRCDQCKIPMSGIHAMDCGSPASPTWPQLS